MAVKPEPWLRHDESELDAESLQALFDDRIPTTRMRGFASTE